MCSSSRINWLSADALGKWDSVKDNLPIVCRPDYPRETWTFCIVTSTADVCSRPRPMMSTCPETSRVALESFLPGKFSCYRFLRLPSTHSWRAIAYLHFNFVLASQYLLWTLRRVDKHFCFHGVVRCSPRLARNIKYCLMRVTRSTRLVKLRE